MATWKGYPNIAQSTLTIGFFSTIASTSAQAHSFGQTFTLPMPFELYAWGSVAVLVVTFVLMLFKNPRRYGDGEQYHSVLPKTPSCETNSPLLGQRTWSRWATIGLQSLGLVGLMLAIYSGLEGTPRRTNNFNMTWFWIIWMLLLVYICGLFGNAYRWFNPFATLTAPLARFEKQCGKNTEPWLELLALASLLAFGYYELFGQSRPYDLSVTLLGYAFVYAVLRIAVGHANLNQHGDFFAVYFAWLGRCAYTLQSLLGKQTKQDLHTPANSLLQVAFIVLLYGITAYDGLKDTEFWVKTVWPAFAKLLAHLLHEQPDLLIANPMLMNMQMGPYFEVFEKTGFVVFHITIGLLFWLAVWSGKYLSKAQLSTRDLALAFAPALIPIILVYSFSHYFTLILTQGVQIVHLISDPLGQGWNLLGTRHLWRAPIILDVQWIWNIQLGSILLGHVVSAIISHHVAFQRLPNRNQANLSQLPILVVMIVLTVFGLWILSQPLQIG